MIKRLALSFVLLFSGMWAVSQNLSLNKDYLDYIEKYYQLAVRQQKEYGIPASITLAQGLLESSAGKSTFAVNTNNHFGIKCHDWKGDTYYMVDDEKNECFRKYDKVIDSYEDHSSYLKSKPRYSSLFQLNPTDYKGWAAGFKKAGYATDPSYATKLITLIENYQLNRFDQGKLSEKEVKEQDKTIAKDAAMGIISASARHMVYWNNNIRYVVAQRGDTYGSIADEFDTSERRLHKYNETDTDDVLQPGDIVYLQRKKSKASFEFEFHVVQEGESMYSISQRYAMKVKKLYDLNKMDYTKGPAVGQELKLR